MPGRSEVPSMHIGRDAINGHLIRVDDNVETVNVSSFDPLVGNDESRRGGSPYVSPALRPSSRESTPNRHRVTIASLTRRPRSNPRTRTPMRYESPLDPEAFRRGEHSPQRIEAQRITVRPLAGAPVGSSLGARRIREIREGRPVTPLSAKQGPSHRKMRRWNNDSFSGIASEISKGSKRGAATAEIFLKAQADAPLFVSVYNPEDRPESMLSKFMVSDDVQMKLLRDDFFEGAIGYGSPPSRSHRPTKTQTEKHQSKLSPEQMLSRIPERLRNVIIRACSNSASTVKIVDAYENFLVHCFANGKAALLEDSVSASLLESPSVVQTDSGSTVARFCFDSESSAGGFHRLLLHAVCQFHSLFAVSRTIDLDETQSSRLLTVTGTLFGPDVHLSQVISNTRVAQATASLSSLHL